MLVTDKAVIESLDLPLTSEMLGRWLDDVKEAFPQTADYRTVFRGKRTDGAPVLIGAAGRLCGFSVKVSKKVIRGEIDAGGKIVAIMSERSDEGCDTVPFPRVFKMLDQLHAELKKYISPLFYDVPVYGGFECILISDDFQRIADYAFPEIALYGDGERFHFFKSEKYASSCPAPGTGKTPSAEHSSHGCGIRDEKLFADWESYRRGMAVALDKLKREELKKIIVARMDRVIPEKDFDPYDFAAYLENRYYQEYFYKFRHGSGAEWIGVSPGVIMKMHAGEAMTASLAGTVPKTADPVENEKAKAELLASEKNCIEHEHALSFMFDSLKAADLGDVRVSRHRVIVETPYTFHLLSELAVRLKDGCTPFDVIGAFYPPAATWGIPVDVTEKTLPLVENFPRGFYAGVYGYWTYSGDANTASVIRTCRIEDGAVDIFAGGGIVKESDTKEEFEETVAKMSPLRGYFRTA